jgi:hypothetical protein
MTLMKLKILNLLIILIPLFSYAQTLNENNNIYIQDFEFIKKSMLEGYANLSWAKTAIKDIVLLEKTTRENLSKAKTSEEAKKIYDKFLFAFNDGHLELTTYNNPDSLSENILFNSTTTSDQINEYVGNERVITNKFYLPLENDSNFLLLNKLNNPFPIGILNLKNGTKIGFLRMAVFVPEYYTIILKNTWEIYRKKLTSNCDEACLEIFINQIGNELLSELNRELDILKANNIEHLIIDLTDNGGGTNWGEAVARNIASKKLNAAQVSLVQQEYTKEIFERKLKLVVNDLNNKNLSQKQIRLLKQSKEKFEKLIKESSSSSIDTNFWNTNQVTVSKLNLTNTPYFASGLFPYLPKNITKNLSSKGNLFSPSEFNYQEHKNNFKLYLLVDRNTASAAEYFTALLKDNKCALIIGEKTNGCGCGFVEGGVKYILPNTKFLLKLPNCSRFRIDGTNEYKGITPDINIWNKNDNKSTKLEKLIDELNKITMKK